MKTKQKRTASSKKAATADLKIRDLKDSRDVKGGVCAKGEHLKDGIITH